MKFIKGCAAVAAIVMVAINVSGQTNYKKVAEMNLDGDGKWDYLQFDEKSNHLFVAHFDRVHVIDTKTNKEIKTIQNLGGVHGIALSPEFNKGFISNGKTNAVTVFDYTTLDSLTTIATTGQKPDAIMFDTYSKKVWTFCGQTNNATVIDPATNTVVATVAVGEVPEFAVSDTKGMIYDNLEDGNAVVMMDANKNKVVKTFALHDKAAPTGLAIDNVNKRLFTACAGTNKLVVLDASSGTIITTLPISNKVDAVSFDAAQHLIFCSGGDGIITIIRQVDKDLYESAGEIHTATGAKTMTIDPVSHKLYTCTAGYESDQKTPAKGTFRVMVYGL